MENLRIFFEQNSIDFSSEKELRFEKYMEGILAANEHVNLTAITERNEFVRKHFLDSLLCADSDEFINAQTIIDVGTGGGFPGVPLAIAFPEKNFVLMDSLAKRLKIIDELTEQIGIGNVKTIHGRAEDLAKKNFTDNQGNPLRENFDICVSRAVANMSTLTELCLPFVKVGGCMIAYKGPDAEKEISESGKAIEILGGRLNRISRPAILISEESDHEISEHRLVFIDKIVETPERYPRKAGKPAKDPIR